MHLKLFDDKQLPHQLEAPIIKIKYSLFVVFNFSQSYNLVYKHQYVYNRLLLAQSLALYILPTIHSPFYNLISSFSKCLPPQD